MAGLDDPEPEVPVPLPTPVPVPVPVPAVDPLAVETFCKTPRSISEPLFRMTPWKAAVVLFVPKASVSLTIMVQSEFTTYVPTAVVAEKEDVELARIFPEPSKYSVPADEKGTVFVPPPTNWPTPVLVNAGAALLVPVPLPLPDVPVPVVFVPVESKEPGSPFPIAE
jgi:hypothetical protein